MEGWHPDVTVHRLANLLEEALVQATRSLANQHLAHPVPDVLVGVQGALGDVEERSRPHPRDTAFYKELVLPFQHVEGLVLAVLDVGRRSGTRSSGDLEQCVSAAGHLARNLVGAEFAHHPRDSTALPRG